MKKQNIFKPSFLGRLSASFALVGALSFGAPTAALAQESVKKFDPTKVPIPFMDDGARAVMAQNAITKCVASKKPFGVTRDGQAVELVTLKNANGLEARIITYGATVIGLDVPDKNGVMGNIVLGFDNIKDYEEKSPYFGATIGRVSNRIAKGTFDLDGKTYNLAKNDGANTLHGGLKGFDKKVWKVSRLDTQNEIANAQMDLISPDMDENFPGNLTVTVDFSFSADNELSIGYFVKTDKATPLSLTNHSYFNLSGAGKGTILDHIATIDCDEYTPTDKEHIPTGEIKSVEGTPFDFRQPHKIGDRIDEVDGGYDHNFVRKKFGGGGWLAAIEDPQSGRKLVVTTTMPGMQFYTGNMLDGTISGNGGKYLKYGAFCLEGQEFPDALHHANFPNIIFKPGSEMDPEKLFDTTYIFSTTK